MGAEFRSRPYSEAEGASVGCGKDASPELRLKYTFLYSQIEQVGPLSDFVTLYTVAFIKQAISSSEMIVSLWCRSGLAQCQRLSSVDLT